MTDQERLDEAFAYLVTHCPEIDGEMRQKIRDRAIVVFDPQRPNQVVFDVERHRGIMETRYQKGEPMGSFITYWERYAFDPKTHQFEILGVVRPSRFSAGGCED